MDKKGIDLEIEDSIDYEDLLIIYKGKKNSKKSVNEEKNKEEIIEIKTSKEEFIRKFRYFKERKNEFEHTNEIFIHDRFFTDDFKVVVESLRTKKVEIREDNYNELLSLSEKYGYQEFSRSIKRFEKERPDLENLIRTLYKNENDENENENDYEKEEEEYDTSSIEKEEIIASHLDFFLEGGRLKKFKTNQLVRILNSPKRFVKDHHLLFEFVKEILFERGKEEEENLYLLIGTLDYTEMTISEIEYIINSKYYSNFFHPRHTEEAMKTIIDHMKTNERKINELQTTIEKQGKYIEEQHQKNETQQKINLSKEENQDNRIKILEEKYYENIEKQKERIEELTRKYENAEERKLSKEREQERKFQEIEDSITRNIESLTNNILSIERNIETIETGKEEEHDTIERTHTELKTIQQKQEDEFNELKKQIETLKITNENNIQISRSSSSNIQPFTTNMNKENEGLLFRLKKKEKTPFDRNFIVSQSSNDIYNLIDPNTKDEFQISNIDRFIEIFLEEPVYITGIKIFSSQSYFPKTFDIEIDDKLIKNIIEAKELNKKNGSMIIPIDTIRCRKIQIINRGQNWDEGSDCVCIKRIELLSNEDKYVQGVFQTLVYESEDHDPHKCPVLMSSSKYDFNTFHSIDSKNYIGTLGSDNSWIRIEFTRGSAILRGFRLKRDKTFKMRSYKIICTEDASKAEEEWTTLIEIEESKEDEHEILDIYKFSQPSPPTKYVKLIQTGPKWNGSKHLIFYHFDLFGDYII